MVVSSRSRENSAAKPEWQLAALEKGDTSMSTTPYAPVGKMDLPVHGYRLTWGPKGLVIHVTDYHTRPLGIPWELIRELVAAAAQGPDVRDAS